MRVLDQVEEIKRTKLANNPDWSEQDVAVEFGQLQPWSNPTLNSETYDLSIVREEDAVTDRFRKVMMHQGPQR